MTWDDYVRLGLMVVWLVLTVLAAHSLWQARQSLRRAEALETQFLQMLDSLHDADREHVRLMRLLGMDQHS